MISGNPEAYAHFNHEQGDNRLGYEQTCGLVSSENVLRHNGVNVNAGTLWDDSTYLGNGEANHSVVITGVTRDLETESIQGFYINDSGTGESARFVDADTMRDAWENRGGYCVVTDNPVQQ